MKVKIYVDWYNNEIYTEKDFEAKVKEDAEDILEETDAFDDYLEDRYDPSDVFNFTEEEKEKVRDDFREWCENRARGNLLEDVEEYEKEI